MQCLKTARQASYQFCKRNGFKIDYKEAIAEAHLAMCEAELTYKEDKARKKESWVSYKVHQELNKKFKEEHNDLAEFEEEIAITNKTNPEKLLMMSEAFDSFSTAAKEAVELVLTGEIESNEKNAAKKEIKQVLRNKGYSWNKIQKAFTELKTYANSLA